MRHWCHLLSNRGGARLLTYLMPSVENQRILGHRHGITPERMIFTILLRAPSAATATFAAHWSLAILFVLLTGGAMQIVNS